MSTITTINPYSGEQIKTYETFSDQQVLKILENANQQFRTWRKTEYAYRADLVRALGNELSDNSEKYAELMSHEMGKPITQAIAEVEKCAWLCDYYAENAQLFLKDKVIETDAHKSYVSYEPLGVILAIMPWNYPLWQVMRNAIPSLMAGNVCVLKHASSVTGYALLIEDLFTSVGFPDGCFQTLVVPSSEMDDVIKNPIVKAISLTGSEKAGSIVASTAAAEIKKSVLELGGNNACIVLDDADLDEHMETIAWARFQNTGQSCIAAKRFLVHEEIYDEFLDRLVKRVDSYSFGDPLVRDTEISSMSSDKLAAELHKQVEKSVEKGAHIKMGGNYNGAHFEPTILTAVKPGMPAFDEELFGPVASVMAVKSLDEAIELSNASRYGLGVSIFGQNVDRIVSRIPDFYEGAVFVNELVKSDPRLPFGGVGYSGYGRELSEDGIMEFVNRKTVYIK